jgi:hypothetical protein
MNLCRSVENQKKTSKPGSEPGPGIEAWRLPAYCSRGVRCGGGVTLILANARNLRTCLSMPREKAQVEDP